MAHPSNITTGHTIDLYTKSGSIGLYSSLLTLIPDYQVTVAILTAGPEDSVIETAAEIAAKHLFQPCTNRHEKKRQGILQASILQMRLSTHRYC